MPRAWGNLPSALKGGHTVVEEYKNLAYIQSSYDRSLLLFPGSVMWHFRVTPRMYWWFSIDERICFEDGRDDNHYVLTSTKTHSELCMLALASVKKSESSPGAG